MSFGKWRLVNWQFNGWFHNGMNLLLVILAD